MKKRICLILCMLLLTGCGKNGAAALERSGVGYLNITAVDGVCYLMENSGNIYTLDWDTGKRTHYFHGPEDIAWVTDGAVRNLYYVKEDTLHRVEIAAARDTALGEVPDLMEMLLVTEHNLLYWRGTEWDQASGYYQSRQLWRLELETMETAQITSLDLEAGEPAFLRVCRQGDTVYLRLSANGPLEAQKYDKISALDLSTGEETVLAKVEGASYAFGTWAIMEDMLYYQDEREQGFYAVPLDGSGEPIRKQFRGLEAHQNARYRFSEDGSFLAVMADSDMTLYRYDRDTDSVTVLEHFPSGDLYSAVTNGERYAALGMVNNLEKLLLGDLK